MSDPNQAPSPPQKGQYAGIWIPLEILEDPALTLSEKFIFGVISALDAGKGFWMTNDRLAHQIGITPNHASVCISKLNAIGYIRITSEPGGRRVIETVDRVSLRQPYGKNDSRGSRKDGSPLPKKEIPSERIDERIKDKRQGGVSIDLDAMFLLSPWKPTDAFRKAWESWIAFRTERKPKLTQTSAERQINFLIAHSRQEDEAVMILDRSIMNSWMGLFPLPGIGKPNGKIRVNYSQPDDKLS